MKKLYRYALVGALASIPTAALADTVTVTDNAGTDTVTLDVIITATLAGYLTLTITGDTNFSNSTPNVSGTLALGTGTLEEAETPPGAGSRGVQQYASGAMYYDELVVSAEYSGYSTASVDVTNIVWNTCGSGNCDAIDDATTFFKCALTGANGENMPPATTVTIDVGGDDDFGNDAGTTLLNGTSYTGPYNCFTGSAGQAGGEIGSNAIAGIYWDDSAPEGSYVTTVTLTATAS